MTGKVWAPSEAGLNVIALDDNSWTVSDPKIDVSDPRGVLAYVERHANHEFSIVMVAPHPGQRQGLYSLEAALEVIEHERDTAGD